MYIVYHPVAKASLFLTELKANEFSNSHEGIIKVLTIVGIQGINPIVAWGVGTEDRGYALFLEKGKALNYVSNMRNAHLYPLYLKED